MRGFIFLLLILIVYSSHIINVEKERLEAFAKEATEMYVFYDPKNMPESILKELINYCPEDFTCILETATERQKKLGKVWEEQMEVLVYNWKKKEEEIRGRNNRAKQHWFTWLLFYNPILDSIKLPIHDYDITKRVRYLIKIANKKDMTPEYLETVLSNLKEQQTKQETPLFDVSHVIKIKKNNKN